MTLALDAEAAIFGVNELRALVPRRRRWSWRAWQQIERRSDRITTELVFARLIGAGENYFVVHLARTVRPELLEQRAPPDPPDAITKRLRKAVKRIDVLIEMWRDELGVDVEALASWMEFDHSREIRHILVHRLGRWEPGLDPKDPKKNLGHRIVVLGKDPSTYRGAYPLSEGDCVKCANIVHRVVRDTEGALGRP